MERISICALSLILIQEDVLRLAVSLALLAFILSDVIGRFVTRLTSSVQR